MIDVDHLNRSFPRYPMTVRDKGWVKILKRKLMMFFLGWIFIPDYPGNRDRYSEQE